MSQRSTGWILTAGAICFWSSWALMPGVGVTDAAVILRLVGAQPQQVMVSAMLQLLSAALFALAIPGLALRFFVSKNSWGRTAAVLLAVGACGDAADAIYHQLAYEMVRPGVDQAAMLPVMQRMQSTDLLYLLPMIAAFLLGCVALAISAWRLRLLSVWNPLLYALCPLVVLGGRIAGVPGRTIGLTCLGLLSASVAWIGIVSARRAS